MKVAQEVTQKRAANPARSTNAGIRIYSILAFFVSGNSRDRKEMYGFGARVQE